MSTKHIESTTILDAAHATVDNMLTRHTIEELIRFSSIGIDMEVCKEDGFSYLICTKEDDKLLFKVDTSSLLDMDFPPDVKGNHRKFNYYLQCVSLSIEIEGISSYNLKHGLVDLKDSIDLE